MTSTVVPIVEIKPTTGPAWPRFRELWEYRELLWFLVWRDVKVRYKQTVLGIAWAIVQPLTATAIFSVVFGRLAGLPSDGVPYPLFSFTGVLAWNFVATGITRAASSLVSSSSLVTKVYFPRMLVPMAAALGGAPDFAVTFVMLFGVMAFYRVSPGAGILALPLVLVLAFLLTLGIGLWLAALNARYRDVGHIAPFLIQMWLYASPIGYSSHVVKPEWRLLYSLNPMVGVVEGFRWSVLGSTLEPGSLVAPSVLVTLALLISGAYYFCAKERTVADVI